MLVTLSPIGAAIVTAQMLKIGRTDEQVADKPHRPNFMQRVCAVATVLATSPTYEAAAEQLHAWDWFSGVDILALATGMEKVSDNLADCALGLGLPIDGLTKAAVQPAANSDDIPI